MLVVAAECATRDREVLLDHLGWSKHHHCQGLVLGVVERALRLLRHPDVLSALVGKKPQHPTEVAVGKSLETHHCRSSRDGVPDQHSAAVVGELPETLLQDWLEPQRAEDLHVVEVFVVPGIPLTHAALPHMAMDELDGRVAWDELGDGPGVEDLSHCILVLDLQ